MKRIFRAYFAGYTRGPIRPRYRPRVEYRTVIPSAADNHIVAVSKSCYVRFGYLVLRRSAVRWPVYALAGAGPGVLLFFAELLTRTAGARVLELAGRVSELERAVQSLLSTGRFNSALIVLFIGAITAIVAIGRTLGPPAED